MPSYPLYYEAKEELKLVRIDLTDEQEKRRRQDTEVITALDNYYEPYRERWRRAGALFNLVQTGTDDVVSNWYLGWGRVLMNHSTAMLSAGVPEGDYESVGPSDHKKKILWNSLVSHALNKSNWSSHQRQWIQDIHRTGNAVTRNYSQVPMRKKPFMRNGSKVDLFVRDFRRAKVGMRVRSPFRCMRSTGIIDPDETRIGTEREDMDYNTFVIRYKNAINEDGTKKYDTGQVPVGRRVQVLHIEDEEENEKRAYALAYQSNILPTETTRVPSSVNNRELGAPIIRTPLSRFKLIGKDDETIIGGENVHGLSSLTFARFDDQLDGDYETHAVCGMGIPDIIEGPEAIMQALTNMTIDNVRLKNTVPISYIPNSPESPAGLDIDVQTMYSGLMMDGQIRASPLGVADVGSNTVMWEWLKTIMYQLTGINPEQLTGDNIRTAFQSGLLLRQMNMRASDRITAWENGPFKRMWTLLLADVLAALTEEEWEEITEQELDEITDKISKDEMPGEDLRENEIELEGGAKIKVMEKRKHFYFPVKGHKFREDFTGTNKSRTLERDSTENTLIEDRTMKNKVVYIPADKKYVYPTGGIEEIMEFDVKVNGKGMLLDLRQQDMNDEQRLMNMAIALKPGVPRIDLEKQYISAAKTAGKEESDVMETDEGDSEIKDSLANIIKNIEAGQGEVPATAPAIGPIPETGTEQPPGPPQTLSDLANSTV